MTTSTEARRLTRRTALHLALAGGVGALLFDAGADSAWHVGDLTVSAEQPFDLNDTLPPSVPRGGTFAVSPDGAPLAPGLSLSATGWLMARHGTNVTHGVVFTYEPPATEG